MKSRLQRRHALDLDQHLRIGQRLHHAGGARGIGRRPERAGIQRIHRGDVGRARQQHVDLGEIAECRSGFIEHALEVGDDIGELGLEAVGQRALVVEAGDAGDEQQVADAGGEGERRGFDAGGWGEVLDWGHHRVLSLSRSHDLAGGRNWRMRTKLRDKPAGVQTGDTVLH